MDKTKLEAGIWEMTAQKTVEVIVCHKQDKNSRHTTVYLGRHRAIRSGEGELYANTKLES